MRRAFQNSLLNGKGKGVPPWRNNYSDEDVDEYTVGLCPQRRRVVLPSEAVQKNNFYLSPGEER